MMVYAKFQYSLKALFCEPSEICEYKRKLYMYRVPKFRTMLTFTNYGPDLLSSNPTGVGIVILQTVLQSGHAEFHHRFHNVHTLSDIS